VNTAVAFIIFDRPELTARVFEEIRKARPPVLLVVADGPRKGRPDDVEACEKTRAVIDRVDWECDVRKNYAERNLGCGKRVSSGIGWVFTEVDEAIILEDDCLPDPSFFRFCEEMLEKYRDDERIGFIGGVNFRFEHKKQRHSYYFSRGHYIWGWASWRRAWDSYDITMKSWPGLRDNGYLRRLFGDRRVVRYYKYNFDMTHSGGLDTWDYQWFFHCWMNNRWEIMPNVNLVTNLGHDMVNATHTNFESKIGNVPRAPMTFPLVHPSKVALDKRADRHNEADRRIVLFSRTHPLYFIMRDRFYTKLFRVARAVLGNRVMDYVKTRVGMGPNRKDH
jgi:hypothetical protein